MAQVYPIPAADTRDELRRPNCLYISAFCFRPEARIAGCRQRDVFLARLLGLLLESCGNVFLNLGFSPEEATILAMRSQLMGELRIKIRDMEWTQAEAAQVLGISQSRVSDLIRGKFEKFSLDMLITLATRAGKKVELKMAA